MASKTFLLDEQLPVTIYKRKGNRNLRITVKADGQVRVSIPSWAPYKAGLKFASSKQDWIRQQTRPINKLIDGHIIGKAHRLYFAANNSQKITSRVYDNQIIVNHPYGESSELPDVQKAAESASIRALRRQAEKLLPQRLETLADEHDFKYSSVRIKQLRGRWGSCDQEGNIVLNLFLMQLPWKAIDYVLLHELVHTRVLKHGPQFWLEMHKLMPDAKLRRKDFKNYHPVLGLQPLDVS